MRIVVICTHILGVLSLAMIGTQYSSKGIDWRTVWLELIRYKDGSIVSIA